MRLLLGTVLCAGVTLVSCGGDEFSAKGSGGASGSGGAPGGAAGSSAGGSGGGGGAAGGSAGSGGSTGGSAGSGGSTGGSAGSGGSTGGASGGSTGGGGGSTNCHTPTSVKPAPAGIEQVLAVTDDPQPEYPVVDATHVYWTTDTTLWRIDKAGTCLEQIATGATQLEGLVLDGGYAYVADTTAGMARRVPVTGGSFQTVVTGQGPMQTVAVDATDIYWCRVGSGVARRPKDGTGNIQIIATGSPINQCFAIAVDGSYVFAATRTGALARALKAPNSPATTLDSVTGTVTADPVYIGLFGNRVYWTHWLNNPDSGGVRSVTTDGQNLVSITEVHPEGFATDGTSAYWTTPYSPGGAIRKGYAALTTASNLVTNQLRPRGVAIDATHVYWTNFNDRTLRRALR